SGPPRPLRHWQWSARGPPARGRREKRSSSLVLIHRAKRLEAAKQGTRNGRRLPVACQRCVEVWIGHLDELLELGEFALGERGDLAVGKAAENKIHLAGTAMPAAKQQPLAAVVEADA